MGASGAGCPQIYEKKFHEFIFPNKMHEIRDIPMKIGGNLDKNVIFSCKIGKNPGNWTESSSFSS